MIGSAHTQFSPPDNVLFLQEKANEKRCPNRVSSKYRCWPRALLWPALRIATTAGLLEKEFSIRKISQSYSAKLSQNRIEQSFGQSHSEPLLRSRAWSSLAAFTTAHSAPAARVQEQLASGIAAFQPISHTTLS